MELDIRSYDISLDFNELEYEGIEKIDLTTDSVLELDAEGIKILEVSDAKGNPLHFEVKDNKVIVYTGKYDGIITVKFKGRVSDTSILGIYKAPYNGKYLITTQFEAVYARRFIPCVDHPAYKAKFKLTVKVQKDLRVISNIDVKSIREEGNKIVYEFNESPKMSTYLLYLGIGEFEEIKDESNQPIIIVATVPGKIQKGKFALEEARKIINFYNSYFDISYQLPKLHLIAIPEFAAGAMENWGAITFRETALLADEKSPVASRIRVSNVIAHEIAHQWFGDLVTMKWWDDLWLNESFATFMSYKATGTIHPEWDMEANFVLWETSAALEDDSLSVTHPIEAHVENPAEIEHMFDNISYGKGASILRMIEAYVGIENFRKGVINYLKEHSFSNAEGKDLWTSISKATGIDINSIMEDWIRKPGHPVVYAKVEAKDLTLTQRRFSLLGNVENVTYKIPLTMEINGTRKSLLFDNEIMTIKNDSTITSLKVNVNRTGFYRVHYDNFNLIFNANLNNLEKWGLVTDYWDFLLANIISFNEYQDIVNRFIKEDKDHLPVRTITSNLIQLLSINPDKYKDLARKFFSQQYKIWRSKQGEVEKLVYSSILRGLVEADEDFALGLSTLFRYYDELDPNEKNAVAEAYGISTSDFTTLYTKYKTYTFDEEKLRILSGILSIRDPSVVDKVFSLIYNNEIKKQDSIYAIIGLSYNPFVRENLYSYLVSNFKHVKDFVNKVYGGPWALGRLIRTAFVNLGVDKPKEVIEFLNKIIYPEIERDVKMATEYIHSYSKLK